MSNRTVKPFMVKTLNDLKTLTDKEYYDHGLVVANVSLILVPGSAFPYQGVVVYDVPIRKKPLNE